jgi:hypothetical protein
MQCTPDEDYNLLKQIYLFNCSVEQNSLLVAESYVAG